MEPLNLPTYSFNIKSTGGRNYIFDEIRKKYFLLTPEEWVRQNFVQYLASEKQYPKSLIGIEMHFRLNKLSKRSDIMVFDKRGEPKVIVECKSPNVKISQDTFDQIARYNMKFRVDYLMVTNGLQHYCCRMDYSGHSYKFLKEIPFYRDLES
ncbi:MAG: type I restriction enzyme HsdR N-terminal domain-containing protein [Bacteroidales bacterium]|nr:MAG: type I restriction enzyme HsdR N-terminal domain-containing protein [Bacteroidales bacterium]